MENFLYFYIYFVFVGTLIVKSNGNIPQERLCADSSCQIKISHARAISSQVQNNENVVSFKPGDEGDVYARVGDLYEVEIKGKRILAPGKLFVEDYTYVKNEDLVPVPNNSEVTVPPENTQSDSAVKADIVKQLHKTPPPPQQESQNPLVEDKKPENNIDETPPEKGSPENSEAPPIQEQNRTSVEEATSEVVPTETDTSSQDIKPNPSEKLTTSVDEQLKSTVASVENESNATDDNLLEKEQMKSAVASVENENNATHDHLPKKEELKSSVASVETENNVTNTTPLPSVTAGEIVTSNLENKTNTEKPVTSPVQDADNSEVIDGTILPKDSDDEVTVEDDNDEDEEEDEEEDDDDFEEVIEYSAVDKDGKPIKNELLKQFATKVPGSSLKETKNPYLTGRSLLNNFNKADVLDTKVEQQDENNTRIDDDLVKKAENVYEKADNLGSKIEDGTKTNVDNNAVLKEDVDRKNEDQIAPLDESSSKSNDVVTNTPEVTTYPTYEPESIQNPLLDTTTTQSDIHSDVTVPPNTAERVEIKANGKNENQLLEEQVNKPKDNNNAADNGQKVYFQAESNNSGQTETEEQFAARGDNIAQETVTRSTLEVNSDVVQEDIELDEPISSHGGQKHPFINRESNNPYDKPPPVRKTNEDGSFAYDPYQTIQNQPQQSNDYKLQGESVENVPIENSEQKAEQSSKSFMHEKFSVNENPRGLFSTMLETVKKVWYTTTKHEYSSDENLDNELERILYPNQRPKEESGFCEKLSPENCPSSKRAQISEFHPHCASEKDFFTSLNDKILETVDLLVFLGVVALTVLIFAFGYYCISHGKKENALLSKLNIVERSLLASNKEGLILKHELMETKNKLTSIENNSFGSNDMVLALKKELEASEETNLKLRDQVASLETELENAAEAGLELNKIVSDLLSSQGGDDSIISSVEELQKQLNEQQNTIVQINTTLAEKSRENSELQLVIAAQAAKFSEEIETLKRINKELEEGKNAKEAKLIESKQLLEEQMSRALEEKTSEVATLRNEIVILKTKYEETSRKWQKSDARLQALEECLTEVKKNPKVNTKDLVDLVNLKTEILATSRERDSLRERLEGETDARKLLEDHVKIVSEEVSALKQEYTQSEKDKLEAQTRLEVLSSYFKEKETQLQKELSVKEAMWMKQQGETTSTVERVRSMQDELQGLKSQNDSLRAEIEAQAAAHKAQISSLENRAHENWLAARQTERKLEESRSEATALRRKLTSLAGNPVTNDANLQNRAPNADGLSNDLNNASSSLHMESPSSPLLGGLPPPAFLPPPPFMAPPHPFMPMPPPFIPPGEMRPPPLGRLMSPPPPPPHDRYSPSIIDERDRYSPENGRYSPDSRYNYNTDIMSTYDTETDFSPPPSPQTRSAGGSGGGYNNRDRERNRIYKPFSPPPSMNTDRSKKTKGILSSGSADSYDSRKSKGKGKV